MKKSDLILIAQVLGVVPDGDETLERKTVVGLEKLVLDRVHRIISNGGQNAAIAVASQSEAVAFAANPPADDPVVQVAGVAHSPLYDELVAELVRRSAKRPRPSPDA